MSATFRFDRSMEFSAEASAQILRAIPPLPGVVALYGPELSGATPPPQPYLTRTADLRRRMLRLLGPVEAPTGAALPARRLNLRERVARIEYAVTGSEFESALILYSAATSIFGPEEARRRLRLHTPFFLRFTAENAFPRVYTTNRLSKRALPTTFGPFPSRAAADRYCDAVLDLYKLRRCHEDLAPTPEHPGCIYGEMKKCLAPCNQAWSPEPAAAYSAEATEVRRFLDSRGESMVVAIGLEREEASAAMQFERAAELHAQWHKVRAVQALADELVHPLAKLRALIVQRAVKPLSWTEPAEAPQEGSPGGPDVQPPAHDAPLQAAVFLLDAGCLYGPELLSTLGVRAVREQTSVGSSLFAQPLMLQAVPLSDEGNAPPASPVSPAESPEMRAATVIAALEARASHSAALRASDTATVSDHLSLLRRWYYRPEKQRGGEIFFPDANGQWPIRRILNGAARVVLGDPTKMADTQRELAERNPAGSEQKPTRTRTLHEGRPDVERVVPVVERASFKTRRKAAPK